ncbi:MAG: cysteine methyltransferase [Bacteroidetes bacterium HGW-Bacteroidetes-16]|jgi:methylated-DNA-protein-cysteine methyltransferase-like protein|nr:MAG: cysteine methyltransferase [Bacteroidetes bacterium HGW-Bacteroidetes-16]
MKDSFFEKVYQVVAEIPFGRITTYGAIAEYLGSKGASRMVGWALNSTNKFPGTLPAHRVVNRKGLLTGKRHFGGTRVMADLLQSEGIEIKGDQILNFKEKLWLPEDIQ